MKILLTGAHFTPAQAVIEELKRVRESESQRVKGIEIIYVGRKSTREGDSSPSVESVEIPKLGVKFIPITSGRLQRKFTRYTIPSLLKIPVGFFQAFGILLKEKPDVVCSFGGYVAVPVVLAGWLLRIPVVVHEQTLVEGLSNDISNFFANKVAVSFDKKYSFNPKKMVLTGNPLRKEILEARKLSAEAEKILKVAESEKLKVVLVMGGNQGSHAINQAVLGALENLTREACVIHQTGESNFRDFEALEEKSEHLEYRERYLPKKWIREDIGAIMARSDLAVCRSGANTLLELAYFGVPSLSIPLPVSSRDEQVTNAKFFKKLGLLEILPQEELSSDSLAEKVEEMLKKSPELKRRAFGAKSAVVPDGAKRLVQEILLLCSK